MKSPAEIWSKIASIYEDKFMSLPIYNQSYDHFCSFLTENARLLEIGCGPGNISRYLLEKRPDCTLLGTDYSENMLALAQKNNPQAEFKILDAHLLDTLPPGFDGVIAGFILPYFSKEESNKLIKDCFQLLNAKGMLYLSFVEGSYTNSAWMTGSTGDSLFFHFYETETILDMLQKNHFTVLDKQVVAYPRKDEIENHIILIAKK